MTQATENEIQDLPEDNFEQPTKFDLLKRQADALGIAYRGNISEAKLEEKVNAFLEDKGEDTEQDSESKHDAYEDEPEVKQETKHEAKLRSQKLIRVVINPVDPRRTQLKGELIFVGNAKIGMTGKYVPYNVDSGYYIPQIIYNDLVNRKYSEFYKEEDGKGNEVTRSRLRNAYVISILPDITEEELNAIKSRQQAQQ